MADKKISALTAYTTPLPDDILPITDIANNITKKVSFTDFETALNINNVSGSIDITKINASGTLDNTTFLRGDGTWAVPVGGGGGGTVDSVNGQTGIVSLNSDDISEGGTNLYLTSVNFLAQMALADTDDLPQGATNKYNQTHTGDVTGSVALTIANDAVTTAKIINSAVTLAKIANIADGSFLGNNTGGVAAPVALTTAEAKTMLGLTGTNSGDQTITLTGDVTGSGTGSFATTLASGVDATKIADGTISNTEFQYLNGATSNIQTQLNALAAAGVADGDKGDITVSSSGAVWTIDNLTITNAKVATGIDAVKLADGSVTNTELQYINTLSSNAQTQLDAKAPLASPTFTGTVTAPTILVSGLTASQLVATDASKNLQSLTTATFPSLGEIAYVKGVTSAIQTQLDTKIETLGDLGVTSSAAELNILDGATLTVTELNYVDGVTSAIQTQIDSKANDADVVHDTGNETVAGVKTFTSFPVTPNASPTTDLQVANKLYVDTFAQGLQYKGSVTASTTTTLPANTYNNGTLGVGATLTGNANGALSAQDGITLTVNQTLLVKNEGTPAYNGPYTLTQVGTGGTPYILTRFTNYDVLAEATQGSFISVLTGTTQANTVWAQSSIDVVTMGTSDINFSQLAQPNNYVFADGTAGTDFDVVTSGLNITMNLPTASAANRGALSTSDWTLFNSKMNEVGSAVRDNEVAIFNGTGGKDVKISDIKMWNDPQFTPGYGFKIIPPVGEYFVIRGADNTGAGTGGPVIIAGGLPEVGDDGAGGGVGLIGADGEGEGAGGVIAIQSGSGVLDTGGAGGAITITSGNGTTAGDITILAGNAQDELQPFTSGGAVTITAGASNSSLGIGGQLTLNGGGGSSGTGGSVSINATAGTFDGGSISIGAGAGASTAGTVTIQSGTSSASAGGTFQLLAGNGDFAGGEMIIQSGSATGTGAGGNMTLTAGNGSGAGVGTDGGSIHLLPGIPGFGSPAGKVRLITPSTGFSVTLDTSSYMAGNTTFAFSDDDGIIATDSYLAAYSYLHGPVAITANAIPIAISGTQLQDSVYTIDTDPVYATPAIMRPETDGPASPFIIRAANGNGAFTAGGSIYLLGGDTDGTDSFQTGGGINLYAANGNGSTGASGGSIELVAGTSTGIQGGDITIASGEVSNFGPVGGTLMLKVGGSTDGNGTNGSLKVRAYDIGNLAYRDTTLVFDGMTANRTVTFQDASGTVAYLSDITSGLPTQTGNSGKFLTTDGSSASWDLVSLTSSVDGTLQAAQMPIFTGDVTTAGGSLATTIANNVVTNAKLDQMATLTIKGNATGGTANASDLTATQVTSMLNNMVGDSGAGGTKGLVPAPSAGDAAALKFLKADGTWAVPAGGAGSPGGSTTQLQYNNAGAFGGITGATSDGSTLSVLDANFRLIDTPSPTKIATFQVSAISAGTTRVFTLPNANGTLALTTAIGTTGTDLAWTATGQLLVPSASATARGVVTTGSQTIAGSKTFTGQLQQQSASGSSHVFIRGTGTFSVDKFIQTSSVQTTTATTTTAFTGTPSASTVTHITAYVVGRSTASAKYASYVLYATIVNTAGTASLVGSVTQAHVAETDGTWNATIDVSGGNYRVRVTSSADTIAWGVTVEANQII